MRIKLHHKRPVRLPAPVSAKRDAKEGFSLRQIEEADRRFAAVKLLRKRLEELKEDAGVDSVQKEFLAGRAVFLLAFLESMEVTALEGRGIHWPRYIQAVRSLGDVLNKLGLDKSFTRRAAPLEMQDSDRFVANTKGSGKILQEGTEGTERTVTF